MTARVILADADPITRLGLAQLAEALPAVIVGETGTGTEAVALTTKHQPDLLILEAIFPDISGMKVLEQVAEAAPSTRVVFLSTRDNPTYVARSIVLGAKDYLTKDLNNDRITTSLRRALDGEQPLSTSPFRKLAAVLDRPRDRGVLQEAQLTYREYQLLRHVGLGLSNREIAGSLEISIETVKEHVQNILRKTDAADRTQIAVWAIQAGII